MTYAVISFVKLATGTGTSLLELSATPSDGTEMADWPMAAHGKVTGGDEIVTVGAMVHPPAAPAAGRRRRGVTKPPAAARMATSRRASTIGAHLRRLRFEVAAWRPRPFGEGSAAGAGSAAGSGGASEPSWSGWTT